MRISVVYVFPLCQPSKYEPMARRFAQTYVENPPGETDHELYVVVNGRGKITERQERLFDPLVPHFLYHDNSAKDLGAYFMAARTIPSDFMVCIGSHARPRAASWLDMIVRAVEDHGPGVYGPWAFHVPKVHIRTTVFAITTELLNAYPVRIDDSRRYEFEWGDNSITLWCLKHGFQAMQVTACGAFCKDQFHHAKPQDCLFEDRHSDSLPK